MFSSSFVGGGGVGLGHGGVGSGGFCRMCANPGADVQFLGCNCEVHARCVPLNLVISEASLRTHEMKPVAPNSLLCPACNSQPVSKIYIKPLSSYELDRAVALKKEAQQKKLVNKTPEEVLALQAQAETSYLLLAHSQGTSGVPSDHDYQRTGRWTDEEITFTDFLVEAFDNGRLPLEHGLKLNEFLSDMLLCKSSRLTKKMKNARLSVRSYSFTAPTPRLDLQMMASLEQKFLDSITSEVSRLEIKFNLGRLWRSHLSNLCLQVGSHLLDANDWIASMEALERRASETEENLRKVRRRKMGIALKTDTRNDQGGVFFGGVPVQHPAKKAKVDNVAPLNALSSVGVAAPGLPRVQSVTDSSTHSQYASSDDEKESDFISNLVDMGAVHADYASILDDLAGGHIAPQKITRTNCGPFIEELIAYMEQNQMPFQHVDLWVPSFRQGPGDAQGKLRLFNAGYGTRRDIDHSFQVQLDEFGQYSTRFSFGADSGLPGRVFMKKDAVWERRMDEADPQFFERAGGAKVYGVKTGFGMPLTTNVIGLIVVIMYSFNDIPVDQNLMSRCISDLSRFCPEPKWKLVVEMVNGDESTTKTEQSEQSKLLESQREQDELIKEAREQSQQTQQTQRTIAELLGEHMPLSTIPMAGPGNSNAVLDLLPHFMSLRLLLLRNRDRRSERENDVLDIITKSYHGYVSGGRHQKRDIALLLARDWQYLSSADVASTATSGHNSQQHQSHLLDARSVTSTGSGAPVAMPRALSFVDPSTVSRSRSNSAASGCDLGLNIVEKE